jgi:serine/threonine protein kinase
MGAVCAGQGGVHFISEDIHADQKQAHTLCGNNACLDAASWPVEYACSQSSSPATRRLTDAQPLLARARLLAPHHQLRCADYYHVGDKLGEGSFGNVYESLVLDVDPETGRAVPGAQDDPSSIQSRGRHVAVKIFQMDEGSSGGQAAARARQHDARKFQSFEAERVMLAQLEHPNIVRMYECFQEPSRLCIVLELCRGGELYGRLVQHVKQAGRGGGLEEPLSRHLFRQMLHAVGYLHSKRIVHRDIKTENFLLVDEDGGPQGDVLKLCDFGTSCRLTDDRPRSMENIGTLSYTAPEIYEQRGADLAADCWSLGVVLYVILTGTNPFRLPGKTCKEDVIKRIKAADFEIRRRSWLKVSTPGQDIVRRLLVLDEAERLTCTQALQSRWAAGSDRHSTKVCSVDSLELAAHVPRVVTMLLRLPNLLPEQRLALAGCAIAASEGDLDQSVPWRALFLALDADQDGRLGYDEMVEGLQRMLSVARSGGQSVMDVMADLPRERLAQSVEALDLDQSGAVDWVEWIALALFGSADAEQAVEPMSIAFRLLDRPVPAREVVDCAPDAPETVRDMLREWRPPARPVEQLPGERMPAEEQQDNSEFGLSHLRLVLASLEVYKML